MSRIHPLPLSLFALLRADLHDVPLIRCSKSTLVHISHLLEDLVLSRRLPALVCTGFQESSHWRRETARYRALADVAQQVCIFAGGGLPPESSASQLHVTLAGDDPLRQEWFLAILSPAFAVVLCGQDQHSPGVREPQRQFDTILSFTPEVINRVLDLLEDVVANYRPERLERLRQARAELPPPAPDPAIVTGLLNDLVAYEERLNQALQETSHEIERQLQWRSDLTETLVHDLRTPLQSLFQTVDFLRQTADLDEEARAEMLQVASLSLQNLNALVQTILDTNRLERDDLQPDLVPVAPAQLFTDALGMVGTLTRQAKIDFALTIDPELKLIWCDPALIGRVLQNLVGNAIKYTPSGGRISLEIGQQGERVRMVVRDTGMGIIPQALPQIFERYYRSTGDRRGYGIGLYFCRLAVEAHGGSISAQSQLGVGTTITVLLPRRPRV